MRANSANRYIFDTTLTIRLIRITHDWDNLKVHCFYTLLWRRVSPSINSVHQAPSKSLNSTIHPSVTGVQSLLRNKTTKNENWPITAPQAKLWLGSLLKVDLLHNVDGRLLQLQRKAEAGGRTECVWRVWIAKLLVEQGNDVLPRRFSEHILCCFGAGRRAKCPAQVALKRERERERERERWDENDFFAESAWCCLGSWDSHIDDFVKEVTPPPPPPTTLIPHIEVGFKWMWTQLATPNKMAPVFVDLCAGLVVLLPRQIRRFRPGFFSSAVLDWSLRSCLRVRHLWRQQIADNRRYLRRSFLPWISSLRSQTSVSKRR